MMQLIFHFAIGGLIVSLFAALGDVLNPYLRAFARIGYSIINMDAYSVVTISLIFAYCPPDTTCFVSKSAGS